MASKTIALENMNGTRKSQLLPQLSTKTSVLRHKEDIRQIACTAIFFLTFILSWQSFASPFCGILSFTAWLALFQLSFMGAVATHNVIHLPVFYDSSLNSLYQICLSLQYGGPVSVFVPGHNLSHHKYPQQARDFSECLYSISLGPINPLRRSCHHQMPAKNGKLNPNVPMR